MRGNISTGGADLLSSPRFGALGGLGGKAPFTSNDPYHQHTTYNYYFFNHNFMFSTEKYS